MRPPPGRLFGWYQLRWIIEQLFRVMKSQGLQLEGSQLVSAERLVKLAAVATKAACLDIQLTQGRDGTDQIPASNAFTEPEIDTLAALGPSLSVFSPDTAPADRCRASPPAPLRRMPRSITDVELNVSDVM